MRSSALRAVAAGVGEPAGGQRLLELDGRASATAASARSISGWRTSACGLEALGELEERARADRPRAAGRWGAPRPACGPAGEVARSSLAACSKSLSAAATALLGPVDVWRAASSARSQRGRRRRRSGLRSCSAAAKRFMRGDVLAGPDASARPRRRRPSAAASCSASALRSTSVCGLDAGRAPTPSMDDAAASTAASSTATLASSTRRAAAADPAVLVGGRERMRRSRKAIGGGLERDARRAGRRPRPAPRPASTCSASATGRWACEQRDRRRRRGRRRAGR